MTDQTSGFDVELAQAVCELNGWTYKGVPINWDAKEAELESGSIDCIWSGFTINGPEESLSSHGASHTQITQSEIMV